MYYVDVKDDVALHNRFEAKFVSDEEAIMHSKELAAGCRQRHIQFGPGLIVAVLDPSGRKIHEELVYPVGAAGPLP